MPSKRSPLHPVLKQRNSSPGSRPPPSMLPPRRTSPCCARSSSGTSSTPTPQWAAPSCWTGTPPPKTLSRWAGPTEWQAARTRWPAGAAPVARGGLSCAHLGIIDALYNHGRVTLAAKDSTLLACRVASGLQHPPPAPRPPIVLATPPLTPGVPPGVPSRPGRGSQAQGGAGGGGRPAQGGGCCPLGPAHPAAVSGLALRGVLAAGGPLLWPGTTTRRQGRGRAGPSWRLANCRAGIGP